MKILYRQSADSLLLQSIMIESCCLKHLLYNRDQAITSKKEHHHTGYEIHFIKKGHQEYKIGSDVVKLNPDSFILIPPLVRHSVIHTQAETEKYSLVYTVPPESILGGLDNPLYCDTHPQITQCLYKLACESNTGDYMWQNIAEANIYQILVYILRKASPPHTTAVATSDADEDVRLSMAKQYIRDNCESNLKVSEVASYCYISTKQLTRLFLSEDTTPAEYIRKHRIARIEHLLGNSDLSLRELSEKMNFSSEYQFNSFFKKYAGMPPGEYRKMKP